MATYRCDDTRGCIIQFWPPGDEHRVLETCRGMKETCFKTKILCTKLVNYWDKIYWDARSAKHQNLSRLVSSPSVKSVSEKCRLQTYCLDSFLACCALQGMPSLSAHRWALCKNGTRKYKNETVIPLISVSCYIFTARWMPFVTPTVHCVLCWLQHIGQIRIYSEYKIRHLIKHWKWTNSSSSCDIN